VHGDPDLMTVWNEAQAREGVELHGLPRERIAVVGAHPYDHWFGREPSSTRSQFLSALGLPADRPLILYVCSSVQIARREQKFIANWVRALRSAGGPAAREASVLVRPHPLKPVNWEDLSDERVVVWPPEGVDPIDPPTQSQYFDSLYHADAVVGVNTSALLEAAILEKPVLSVLVKRFAEGQLGTLHFHHLLERNGGPLVLSSTLEEHAAALDHALVQGSARERSRRFVESFLRPQGIEHPATPRFADAIEALAAGLRRPGALATLPPHEPRPSGEALGVLPVREARG
jgi:hypothetical protein